MWWKLIRWFYDGCKMTKWLHSECNLDHRQQFKFVEDTNTRIVLCQLVHKVAALAKIGSVMAVFSAAVVG